MGEGMMRTGKYRRSFFPRFLWITRVLWRKRVKVIFRLYMCPQNLITIWPIIENEKIWNTIMTISHEDIMPWENSLSWNVLVLQNLKRQAPTVFLATRLILETKGAEWSALQKYRVFLNKISNFQKLTTPGCWKCFTNNKSVMTLKRKWNARKTLFTSVEQTVPLRLIWISTL